MAERISLVEQYDNKDMIVQMKKCLDRTADAVTVSTEARDTAAASATEAHTASTNANAASTQAQTAAATVAGYNDRLATVEGTVQGHGAEIQHLGIETRNLYDRDANNVKVSVDHIQNVENGLNLGGINRVSNTTVGELNDMIVNAKRLIEEIESKLNSYEPMVRTSGSQTIAGVKTFINDIIGNFAFGYTPSGATGQGKWGCLATFPSTMLRFTMKVYTSQGIVDVNGGYNGGWCKTHKQLSSQENATIRIVKNEDGTYTIWFKHTANYATVYISEISGYRYAGRVSHTIHNGVPLEDDPVGVEYYECLEYVQ